MLDLIYTEQHRLSIEHTNIQYPYWWQALATEAHVVKDSCDVYGHCYTK